MRNFLHRLLLTTAALVLTVVATAAIAPQRALAQATTSPSEVINERAQNAVRETNVAGAPEEEAPQGGLLDPDLGTAFFTVLVFIVLLVLLGFTAWKPILGGLKARERAIRDSVEAAARAKADAERTTRELEAKMAEAQRQSAQQLQQAKADAQKVADAIRQQAEAEASALKDRTLREIDGAKQQALSEINSHAAALGTAVASKILKRSVTADDQQRLVEESLSELAKKN